MLPTFQLISLFLQKLIESIQILLQAGIDHSTQFIAHRMTFGIYRTFTAVGIGFLFDDRIPVFKADNVAEPL